jgi:hypothetical protein
MPYTLLLIGFLRAHVYFSNLFPEGNQSIGLFLLTLIRTKRGRICWHVYRQSVLFIDGKNNNNDGMFTGRVFLSSMEKQEHRKLS